MVNESVTELAAKKIGNFSLWVENVRSILKEFYLPKENTEDAKNAEKMAEAVLAIEVGISIANIFRSLSTGGTSEHHIAIADLTYVLNTNRFWNKNAGYLGPILNNCINDALDANLIDIAKEPLWEKLNYHNRYACLDMFPNILFLLKGYAAMRFDSLKLKKSLENLV